MCSKLFTAIFVLTFGLAGFNPAYAGGTFYSELFESFCSGTPHQERVGCRAYLQFRIKRGKSRDEALDTCIWSCGEIDNDAGSIESCRNGCRMTNSRDY